MPKKRLLVWAVLIGIIFVTIFISLAVLVFIAQAEFAEDLKNMYSCLFLFVLLLLCSQCYKSCSTQRCKRADKAMGPSACCRQLALHILLEHTTSCLNMVAQIDIIIINTMAINITRI